MDRFVVDFKITNNNETLFIDIPYGINLSNARFLVSGIAGKMSSDNVFVQIAVPQLTNSGKYTTFNNGSSIIASNIFSTTATKPTNRVIDKNSIGYKVPTGTHNQSAPFTIKLLNESGTEYADNDINWMVISITFWNPI